MIAKRKRKSYREQFRAELDEIVRVEHELDRTVAECRRIRRRRDLTTAEKQQLIHTVTGQCLARMPAGWR